MRRIIAYIYRYKGEEKKLTKCGNVGFCRVEEVESKITVNICFKETSELTGKCKIYSLKKNVELNGIDVLIDKPVCEGQMVCGKLCVKVEIKEGTGLLFICGENKYIVLWDGEKETIIVQNKREENEKIKETPKKKIEEQNIHCDYYIKRAYNNLPKVPMIIDGVRCQAVKLGINDIAFLPRKYWRLANNFFLMESYFCYSHILFFKYGESFVLGVPGNGNPSEILKANKCGFSKNVNGYQYGKEEAKKIYWIKYLDE